MIIHVNELAAKYLNIDDEYKYWGEYEKKGNEYHTKGIGVFYQGPFKYGMFDNNCDGYCLIKNDLWKDELGMNVNGQPRGPRLIYDKGCKYRYFNDKGNLDKFAIDFNNDSCGYVICEFNNGSLNDRSIEFRYGKLCLVENGQVINYIDAGYMYEIRALGQIHLDEFWDVRSTRPAKISYRKIHKDDGYSGIGTSKYYHDLEVTYNGATQCVGDFHRIDDKTNEEIWHERDGLGFEYFKKGEVYFGSYFKDNRSGYGVYKYSDGNVYLGGFNNGYKHGAGLLIANDYITVGEFVKGKKAGMSFEIINNELFIRFYVSNEVVGCYFKVREGLSIEKYEGNKLIEKVSFDDPYKELNLTPKDKINPNELEALDKDYIYEINDDCTINIIRCLNYKPSITLPSRTYKVMSNAFDESKRKMERLRMGTGCKVLEDGAFKDLRMCEFVINEVIEELPSYTSTSKELKELVVPKNVKKINEDAFSQTGLKTVSIENNNCDIKRNAFPKGCKIIYPNKVKKEKVKNNKSNSFDLSDITYNLRKGFRKFFRGFASLFSGGVGVSFSFKSLLSLVLLGALGFLGWIGVTRNHDMLSWTIEFNGSLFGYSLELFHLVYDWFESTDHDFFTALTLGLLQILLMVVGFLLDVVVHIVLFFMAVIWLIIQGIFQFLGVYFSPLIFLGLLVVISIKDENNRGFNSFCIVIGVICALLYYIFALIPM